MALYVIDASVFIHIGRNHPPDVFVDFWQQMDASIAAGEICSPEEVLHELKRGTDDLAKVLSERKGLFVPLDEPQMVALSEVMSRCPDLADLSSERNRGDPFVVALARVRGGIAVTRERPRKAPTAPRKIPDACTEFGIQCLDWFAFLRRVGWRL